MNGCLPGVLVALQRKGQGCGAQLPTLPVHIQGGGDEVVQVLLVAFACQHGDDSPLQHSGPLSGPLQQVCHGVHLHGGD